MNIKQDYNKLLNIRKQIDEIDYDNDPIIKQMLDLMTNNINETINYLDKDCTSDEFVWLSEIFMEIIERCPSKDFVNKLYELANKYPDVTKKYNIMDFIKEADDYLKTLNLKSDY